MSKTLIEEVESSFKLGGTKIWTTNPSKHASEIKYCFKLEGYGEIVISGLNRCRVVLANHRKKTKKQHNNIQVKRQRICNKHPCAMRIHVLCLLRDGFNCLAMVSLLED